MKRIGIVDMEVEVENVNVEEMVKEEEVVMKEEEGDGEDGRGGNYGR